MLTVEKFRELVEKYDRIAVFRHTNPDYDALGSQYGIVRFLRNRYPKKDVRAGGEENSIDATFIENPDPMDEEWIKTALAIVVDTSNLNRLDGRELWLKAEEHVLFDHHHETEPPIDYNNLVEVDASSCAEILGQFLREYNEGKILPKDAAEALYAGIISDSIRFSINTTTAETLRTAAYLLDSGLNVNRINNKVFSVSMNAFRFANHLRTIAHYETPGMAWAILDQKDFRPFGLTARGAKTKVSIFGEIRGIQTWAVFVEEDDGTYSASLRSHNVVIRDIAERYKGGGHDSAAGIPSMTREECEEAVQSLIEKVKNA